MQITTFLRQDVELDIPVSEFLTEMFASPDSQKGMYAGLNHCGAFLKSCPDELIEQMGDLQKEVVVEFLQEQSLRFSSKVKA